MPRLLQLPRKVHTSCANRIDMKIDGTSQASQLQKKPTQMKSRSKCVNSTWIYQDVVKIFNPMFSAFGKFAGVFRILPDNGRWWSGFWSQKVAFGLPLDPCRDDKKLRFLLHDADDIDTSLMLYMRHVLCGSTIPREEEMWSMLQWDFTDFYINHVGQHDVTIRDVGHICQ